MVNKYYQKHKEKLQKEVRRDIKILKEKKHQYHYECQKKSNNF